MDVWAAGDTLYATSTKYAVLGRDVLNVPGPKVLITGASNAGVGFRPQLLQPLIPCARVSDLAVGSSISLS
ncbi:MAG: hypothetical protein JO270_16395 [Acidobacteriaceae bacterium]|nr:hypothetical protein [Acidobacteriaceae bacterium]